MGLLGKLLNRQQPEPEVNPDLWQAFPGQVVQADNAAEIAGVAAVAASAYRVHYLLPAVPDASLVIWIYAVEADPEESPGPYAVGYRGECWLGDDLMAAWNEQDWDFYPTPQDADIAAYDYAEEDAHSYNRGDGDDLPFFDWCGED